MAARTDNRLLATWYRPGFTLLGVALLPLSWVYRGVTAIRRALYRRGLLASYGTGVPVVVVGNIVAGGAGKTPLVIALAEALAERGRRPGLVSRGFGREEAGVREVREGMTAAEVGDEPLLLARAGFPVCVGADRVAAARALRSAHPDIDVIVSDDGLQHYRLRRDVEVVAIDGSRGFGNGALLPAGPLREPRSRLDTVDARVTLVGCDAMRAGADGRDTTMCHEPAGWWRLVAPAEIIDPRELVGKRLHAIAGIGNPQRFFDLVRSLGLEAIPHAFPDHHAFTPADLALPEADVILMTAKDAVKCQPFADARMLALDIRARIDPALVDLVEGRIVGRQAA